MLTHMLFKNRHQVWLACRFYHWSRRRKTEM